MEICDNDKDCTGFSYGSYNLVIPLCTTFKGEISIEPINAKYEDTTYKGICFESCNVV
jgi:hypothetical protein